MVFYRLMKRPPTGMSYLRFLILCGGGFSLGGSLLIILGSLVFEPRHELYEPRNIEAAVAWTGGCLSFAISFFFAALSVAQWKKIVRMRSVADSLLVEGHENTLYQAVHKDGYVRPVEVDRDPGVTKVLP